MAVAIRDDPREIGVFSAFREALYESRGHDV
jgi:hypothetical protein